MQWNYFLLIKDGGSEEEINPGSVFAVRCKENVRFVYPGSCLTSKAGWQRQRECPLRAVEKCFFYHQIQRQHSTKGSN